MTATGSQVSRNKVFNAFLERTGIQQFSPEAITSLHGTMVRAECMTERLHAWAKWRAWANSSEYAVDHWMTDRARPLDQIDAAVDLRWLEEGRSLREVVNAPATDRQAARLLVAPNRAFISRQFAQLEEEGRIEFRGHKIHPVIDPQTKPKPKPKSDVTISDEDFQAWMRTQHFGEFEAWQAELDERARAQRKLREREKLLEPRLREFKALKVTVTQSAGTQANGVTRDGTSEERPTSDDPIIIGVKLASNKLASQDPEPDPPPKEPAHRGPIRAIVREFFPRSTYQSSEIDKTYIALKGADLSWLREKLRVRRQKGPYDAGLIATLAAEVGAAWIEAQGAGKQEPPKRDYSEIIEDLRNHWSDYTPEEQEQLRETYEELRE